MFDIHPNHFLFVFCENCGYVEGDKPNILEGKSHDQLGNVLDILFG
ncbi:zinc ribbon domain-containing protein [Paenibacillus alba]|uniref:Zinc ribbon domain-containing protein n=1 Tax=Paenibacillus alba TaxID=1197127 RepID=A0ABU6G0X4_9BACL|nr:zinc ribbon domain-containing protein [Paenibacillus alba]